MPTAQLSDRAVILVAGPDAETLLQNIITTDLASLGAGAAMPGALLTPQGKILFDFLVSRPREDALRLDCRADAASDFLKRLMLYRLRAKAEISLQDQTPVSVSWNAAQAGSDVVSDKRFPGSLQVLRNYDRNAEPDTHEEDWHCLRIEHGVAESGSDFALGEAFPHDVLFDQNGGVGLRKGCYVGQEVVSRMHHRGTARRRLVIARAGSPLPAPGTEVTVDGRPIGALGTVCSEKALAILRIDRAADASKAGTPILAGGVALTLSLPAYAGFSLGGAAEGA